MKELRYFLDRRGDAPVEAWLEKLRDIRGGLMIRTRLNRLADGNPGDYRSVGDGVWELRIHFGPGYRIYYGEDGIDLVILLAAGIKDSQVRDIRRAKERWADYRRGP